MSEKSNLAQVWAKRIADCQASGIKVKHWCRDNNVSASQYYYWIKKLNNTGDKIIENNPIEWAEVSLVTPKRKIDNESSII